MVTIPHDLSGPGPAEPGRDIRDVIDLVRRLASMRQSHRTTAYDVDLTNLLSMDLGAGEPVPPRSLGLAKKVSVSLPEELTMILQQRLGKGGFSQYVTDAVARQLELDLLAELSDLFEAEDGPVPADYVEEARLAWPDAE
jgi:hypothetical protein